MLVPYALETLEAQRAALLEDLGHAPAGKVRVEVVNDASELARVSTLSQREIDQTGTIAICKFNKLMITSPKAVLRGYDWLDTLAHEYTHFVVTQAGHNSVPIWLQEALAKYLESRWHGPAGQGAARPRRGRCSPSGCRRTSSSPSPRCTPRWPSSPAGRTRPPPSPRCSSPPSTSTRSTGCAPCAPWWRRWARAPPTPQAVEKATGRPFAQFEKGWMAYLRSQPVPNGCSRPPPTRRCSRASTTGPSRRPRAGRSPSATSTRWRTPAARRWAHLGELFRERGRFVAAAEEYGKAHALVGSAYESVSNKYALALMAVRRLDEAEKVLRASLDAHPGNAATQVHLGRIYLTRGQWKQARDAYRGALAQDPFDPEIHLALLKSAESLGDGPLAGRARDRQLRSSPGFRPTSCPSCSGPPPRTPVRPFRRRPAPGQARSCPAHPDRPPRRRTKPSEPTSSERL